MRIRHRQSLGYALLFVGGIICLAVAYQQHQYQRFVRAGHQAVLERRFDSQAYDDASQRWFARRNMLLFNQGLLAYHANNLSHAKELFQRASQHAQMRPLRTQSLYNLGLVLLQLEDAQRATELFKQVLRLDPQDKDAKLMLEQLYHLVWRSGSGRQAAMHAPEPRPGCKADGHLEPAPGLEQTEGEDSSGDGQGHSTPPAGI
jgi:tetratricopeptide (TPR) repeat protein